MDLAHDLARDGLPLPRTEVALAALRFAESIEHTAIFHHSVRTYFYGRLLGERRGLQPGRDYDDQLLFLGCVLHDVGLSAQGDGDQRFEVDGADLAAEFLTKQGVPAGEVEVVWDAIALHTSDGIAIRKRPEIALVSAGTKFDIIGGPDPLPAAYVDRVHAALPRLHASPVLRDAIVAQTLDKPGKAPLFSVPGDLHRARTGSPWPTWEQLTVAADWDGYDGYAS
ncbi:HD domain-containing protein [Streptomyces sp. XD-27]|uniref:HD domain-containing protein n=1 Tax=Streptomyces sp. XD-27 TaxID=3062779 RepID=UPI0026F467CC|nr:HD domain-containing protein [Streptomyces sp. XD-27]WKX72783.1 HD domain-containing protein [Streptomyces sp. XD-27]